MKSGYFQCAFKFCVCVPTLVLALCFFFNPVFVKYNFPPVLLIHNRQNIGFMIFFFVVMNFTHTQVLTVGHDKTCGGCAGHPHILGPVGAWGKTPWASALLSKWCFCWKKAEYGAALGKPHGEGIYPGSSLEVSHLGM